jgi:hypothetical protein
MTGYSEMTCDETCTNSGVPRPPMGEPIPEALRESVRELMDPADGPNGARRLPYRTLQIFSLPW